MGQAVVKGYMLQARPDGRAFYDRNRPRFYFYIEGVAKDDLGNMPYLRIYDPGDLALIKATLAAGDVTVYWEGSNLLVTKIEGRNDDMGSIQDAILTAAMEL